MKEPEKPLGCLPVAACVLIGAGLCVPFVMWTDWALEYLLTWLRGVPTEVPIWASCLAVILAPCTLTMNVVATIMWASATP